VIKTGRHIQEYSTLKSGHCKSLKSAPKVSRAVAMLTDTVSGTLLRYPSPKAGVVDNEAVLNGRTFGPSLMKIGKLVKKSYICLPSSAVVSVQRSEESSVYRVNLNKLKQKFIIPD
jgi:hypothetical protein